MHDVLAAHAIPAAWGGTVQDAGTKRINGRTVIKGGCGQSHAAGKYRLGLRPGSPVDAGCKHLKYRRFMVSLRKEKYFRASDYMIGIRSAQSPVREGSRLYQVLANVVARSKLPTTICT